MRKDQLAMLTDQQITDQLQTGAAVLESVPVTEIKSGDYVRYPDLDEPGRTYRNVRATFESRCRVVVGRSTRLLPGRKLVFVDGWNKTSERLGHGCLVERVMFGVTA